MRTEITREELYELAWKTPLTKVSQALEVSYHILRNLCKEQSIPLPVSGHWTRVHLGREVIIPSLPDFKGTPKINLARLRTVKKVRIPSVEETKSLPLLSLSRNPDPLVVEVKNFLGGKERFERDGLLINRSGMLQVKVSKAELSRAMIVLDAFIKLMKSRGHQIATRYDKSYVVIDGEEIGFSLREKTKREQHPKYSYTIAKPLGILIFKMWSFHDREWQDGSVKIDHQLESIRIRMEEEARYRAGIHEQGRIHREEYEEKERQKQAIAERKKKELEEFKAMLEKSKRWNEAVILRNYIQEVERQSIDVNTLTEEKLKWIEWAKAKADWYDPFIEKDDDCLGRYDATLFESKTASSGSWNSGGQYTP